MIINRMAVLSFWRACVVLPEHQAEMENYAKKALLYKPSFYDPVSSALGIPWYVIAALDMREENFSHNGYLGNGDPLWRVTTHVPKGRGPFSTWYEGAIDALNYDRMNILPPGGHWDIVTSLIKVEGYNGMGYATKNLRSPYVWAKTNQQQHAKYVADGHFDPNAWDTQPGCAALFLTLKQKHGVDLNEA